MRVAALQMVSTPDVSTNIAVACDLIAQASRAGAELVALPEYFCLMGLHDSDKLLIAECDAGRRAASSSKDAPLQWALAQAALENGVWLIGGTLPLVTEQAGRVSNSVLVFNPQGEQVARYDKIHLFSFDDDTQHYDESLTLKAGHQPVAFNMVDRLGQTWRVGLGVCYDLRFPELFRALSQTVPCDLLVLPAAFTHTTGKAHWEVLLRARAIENQCHVLAAAQGGLHANGRRTFGHSMVIDPWGEILAICEEGAGVVVADTSLLHQTKLREQLPALDHRRL